MHVRTEKQRNIICNLIAPICFLLRFPYVCEQICEWL